MPFLSQEVWVSRFTTQFVSDQPAVDEAIAEMLAALAWQHMAMMIPESAVRDFLFMVSQNREAFAQGMDRGAAEFVRNLKRSG